MPRVRALRGVCIGVDRHLVQGEVADVDAGAVQFLSAIGAVELVKDEPAPIETESKPSAKAGTKEK